MAVVTCLISTLPFRKLETVGEPTTFQVPPSDAYGEANPDLGPITFPASNAPPGLEAGDRVQLAHGMKARVISLASDCAVTIDANHELAGKAISPTVSFRKPPARSAEMLETATFSGGCFCGVELAFQREPGIVATAVGYTQGGTVSPTYNEFCAGQAGHYRGGPGEV